MLNELRVVLSTLRERRLADGMKRAELEARKLDKFRTLVRHVNERSPYYARLIAERRIDPATCVPADFPILTKTLLMENFDEIVTVPELGKHAIAEFLTRSKDPGELMLGKYRVIHTSGSSGEVGYFVFSPEDWIRGSLAPRRGRSGLGRRRHRGRFRLAYYAATDGHYAGVTMIRALGRGIARLFVRVELFEVLNPLVATVERLNAYDPDFLAGYTTAIKTLAERQRAGDLKLHLLGIGTAGEVTTAADRALLEQAFGCPVINTYGCSEHLAMGSSLPGGSEIVLYDRELIYEFYEDHSIVTNLFNYTLPLIRYRMADVLRPVDPGPHAPYLVIESLVGRNELQPTFRNRDGALDFISPHTINEIFVEGVTRFQLHLLGDAEFTFLVCLESQLDAPARAAAIGGIERRLAEILARKRMENVRFTVTAVNDLPVNPSTRKFQLIVDARGKAPAASHAAAPVSA